MTFSQPAPVFQVSEFIESINHHLSRLGEVEIEGEISRLDVKNGRLIFATIKDTTSSLDVFSMTHMVRNLRELEPGMLVRVIGTPGLYKGSGKFRLFASSILPHGEGSLQIAYEKLKSQLEAEGLFAQERKRRLPEWPKNIGLITASPSSAQADVIKILTTRMGGLHIQTLPVNVQGRDAIPSILSAFAYINNHSDRFDLVIMARGGGSLEDLAAFNSEEICRAVYACKIPAISAVGHEDNWSLTDFVADVRASTPSNAAELAVRDRLMVMSAVDHQVHVITTRLQSRLHIYHASVDHSHQLIRHRILHLTQSIAQTVNKVPTIANSLTQLIYSYQKQIDQVLPSLKLRLNAGVTFKQQELLHLERLLASLDYHQVLKRGYSITTLNGHILINASAAKPDELITTQLAQGKITSKVV